MVKMKKTISSIIYFVIFFWSSSLAGGDSTPTLQMCRNIEMSLVDGFLDKGKYLPNSFEEMTLLREMAENQWKNQPRTLELINSLALVPNAPTIKSIEGISRSLWGWRLFAISRSWNFDYSKDKASIDPAEGGRFVIMISPDGSSATPNWIPEPEARVILDQLKDFDPKKQPLAFENIIQSKREMNPQQNESNKTAREHLRKKGNVGSGVQKIPDNQYPKQWGRYWIAGGVSLAAFLIWMTLRKRAKS